jgi:glycosyltransferase involved in cell wall biosynthesis
MHHIVLVVGQLGLGGLERQVCLLARGLDRARFRVTIVSLQEGGDLIDALLEDGVSVIQIARRDRRDWRRLVKLTRLMRRLRPDLVYSFNFSANAYARLAAILARVPVIVTGERGIYMTRGQALLERLLARFTDRVICNAGAVRRDLVERVGLSPSRVVVVRNGVDVPREPDGSVRGNARRNLGLPPEGLVVGTVARLDSVKNLPLLVEAARRCLESIDAWFCIIGGGPEEGTIRSMTDQPTLRGRVVLAGSRQEARDLLAAFDLFVLTSDVEGLPNAVMEAMALGLPIVCTDVGGCRELIDDDVEGYLVPSRDAALMTDRILRLAADGDLRARLGAAARRRAMRDFASERMVGETEAILSELLVGRAERSPRGRSPARPESVGL